VFIKKFYKLFSQKILHTVWKKIQLKTLTRLNKGPLIFIDLFIKWLLISYL